MIKNKTTSNSALHYTTLHYTTLHYTTLLPCLSNVPINCNAAYRMLACVCDRKSNKLGRCCWSTKPVIVESESFSSGPRTFLPTIEPFSLINFIAADDSNLA